ncbi:MAG: hypothetical protein A2513_01935 [Sulfurimonas sp. RIFOXYD12_FULL_33_39]|uniref:hypothetical protein n=1 Tax=unclassified Sulfurimonas TaxID=2623549 RepID=UPI0008B3B4C4|nr:MULTISPECIES: hypothetical protein [unclassified Sulfurimonas]OHE04026.1 MAG: hypothetical protein A3G74_00775 [Sulfurimonas sp. RIFCSPLOWO2_12_FULL_34_6]OHE08755.1 MAG: hypothetical protein A2513_01935 [Sulfurimonas sp. RIFOXYD12_FULL_33_39]OHE14040.1 MAG: hypothetical protein A2530_03260 [Sulfurimonas sp. RIFOXYD2_FULL_34_21]DAB27646.1 MAG TPA: hypothetical protein CFH78_06780 [Sulfurimonas sp. UBA10385]
MHTSTLMMIFFILLLVVSIWKIYAFLPNRQLQDDDTTREATEQLENLMIKIIKQNATALDNKELFSLMLEDNDFDKKKFWRFNQNRLNHLLSHYFLQNPHVKNIEDIHNM